MSGTWAADVILYGPVIFVVGVVAALVADHIAERRRKGREKPSVALPRAHRIRTRKVYGVDTYMTSGPAPKGPEP